MSETNFMAMFLRQMADQIETPANDDIDALAIIVRRSGSCAVIESHQGLTDAALTRNLKMLATGTDKHMKKRTAAKEGK